MDELRLPASLERSRRVLVAGAGGGFDVYAGLPNLRTTAPDGHRGVPCQPFLHVPERQQRPTGHPSLVLGRRRDRRRRRLLSRACPCPVSFPTRRPRHRLHVRQVGGGSGQGGIRAPSPNAQSRRHRPGRRRNGHSLARRRDEPRNARGRHDESGRGREPRRPHADRHLRRIRHRHLPRGLPCELARERGRADGRRGVSGRHRTAGAHARGPPVSGRRERCGRGHAGAPQHRQRQHRVRHRGTLR